MSASPAAPARPGFVVMGVAGSGKTTIGRALAEALGLDFVDGDDLHPPANVAKMSRGVSLEDADRWPWLDRVGAVLADHAAHPAGAVVACSALRRRYRDRIRQAAAGVHPGFIFLAITPEDARARMLSRKGHFMPPSLVDSQFATLERPGPDETDTIAVSETQDVQATLEEALSAARRLGPA